MSQTSNASQEYLRNAVMTARPEQLQIMLLDGAVRFALKGQEALEAKDGEEAFHCLDRAQRICLQLGAGLNRDINPQIAEEMIALYDFCYLRLVDACVHRNPEAVGDAVRVLKHQRETWSLIAEKVSRQTDPDAAPAGAPAARASRPVRVRHIACAARFRVRYFFVERRGLVSDYRTLSWRGVPPIASESSSNPTSHDPYPCVRTAR